MLQSVSRLLAVTSLLLLAGSAFATTLEKMSLEEMAQKATLIVRGRVGACAGEARNSLIYTRCRLTVTERWKGQSDGAIDFYIPGGTVHGLRQVFAGAPKMSQGDEYVLFLWAGRTGMNHVIGLSQGVFDLRAAVKGGDVVARREATVADMVDKSGTPVTDAAIELRVSELRGRVSKALAGALAGGDQR